MLLSRLCQLVRGHPEGERLGAVAAFLCFCFSFLSSCRPPYSLPIPSHIGSALPCAKMAMIGNGVLNDDPFVE